MPTAARLLLLLAALTAPARAAPPEELTPDYLNRPVQRVILPSGGELMEEVRLRLPRERREIRARLRVRAPGAAEREIRAETVLHFGGNPPSASYLLTDGLGTALERLDISWTAEGAPVFAFAAGPDLTPVADFSPARAVGGLDFNWNDLALAFLWWPGAQVRGQDQVKLRSCYVVEIPAPEAMRAQGAAVRLWVDEKERLVVRAAVIDANGDTLRTIEVDSIKKIDDVWMVKDLDIENLRTGARTRVRVDEIR